MNRLSVQLSWKKFILLMICWEKKGNLCGSENLIADTKGWIGLINLVHYFYIYVSLVRLKILTKFLSYSHPPIRFLDMLLHLKSVNSAALHIKGNKFKKKHLKIFPNHNSEGVIVKKLLCPQKNPTAFLSSHETPPLHILIN